MESGNGYTSIQTRLALLIVVTVSLITAIGFTIIIVRDLDRLKEELINETQAYTELLSQDFVRIIAYGSVDLAADVTARLRSRPMLESIIVYDKDDNPVFNYRKEGIDAIIPYPDDSQKNQEFIEERLLLRSNIKYQRSRFGSVLVQVSTDRMKETRNSYLSHGILFAIALMLASISLVLKIGQSVSRPILHLASVMRKVGDTYDFNTQLIADRDDEIGELYSGFNTMQREIQLANTNLENQKYAFDQHSIVSITDADGTINYVNNRFTEVSGYDRHELIGQNHRLLQSGEHDRSFYEDMYRTIRSGNIWDGEICNATKDGSLIWLDTTIVPQLDNYGQPKSYIAIRTDITHLKSE